MGTTAEIVCCVIPDVVSHGKWQTASAMRHSSHKLWTQLEAARPCHCQGCGNAVWRNSASPSKGTGGVAKVHRSLI